jgi:hypothetical protein
MGRLWLRTLLFLGLTLGLYIGAFMVLSRYGPDGNPMIFRIADYYKPRGGNSWTRYREYGPGTTYDAIIIGSSRAYRGYDPAVFAEHGYRMFNLGSTSQSPLNSYFLIKHYLNSRNAPLLIFDVYEGTFAGTGLESTSDLAQNLPNDAAALEMAWALRDLRGLNLISLRFTQPNASSYYSDPHYKGLGFSSRSDSLKEHMQPQLDETLHLPSRQKHFFEACVRLCQERGIQMVVSSHYAREGTNAKRHGILVSYVDSALAGTGIPYIDLTLATGIDDLDHFEDDSHLNSAGARIFTGHLVDSLEAMGYLHKP